MDTFIDKLPKAELHLHIEGSFEPELMFTIAQRNNISIPYKTVEEVTQAYQFSCLEDFLKIYYESARVLITEKDFFDLTYSYLSKCAEQNIRHLEIMFDPQTHTQRGISFDTVIHGITKACEHAESNFGISTVLIMSYLRHLSEEDAFETLEQSLPYKDKIHAIGLDSSEMGHPPSKFQKVYEASIKAGYVPVAHAGEEGPAAYIWEALELLKIQRIDHGNNALQDAELIDEIISRDMALTVCPLSNLSLKVVDDLVKHPLKSMMKRGLAVTVNSDDPAYFGGHLNDNYKTIQKALELTKEDVYLLAKNSFKYSFADDGIKEQYLNELETYYQNNK